MSIRLQILLPLILLIAAALGLGWFIGNVGIDGHKRVQEAVRSAMAAREFSMEIGDRFHRGQAILDRILAMTTFVPAEEVKSSIETSNAEIRKSLSALAAVGGRADVAAAVAAVQAKYQAWSDAARIVAGLDASSAVPTLEALARKETAVEESIAAVQHLVSTAAEETIGQAGDALAAKIRETLILAAAVSAAVLLLMLVVSTFIARPIMLVTKAMKALARGSDAFVLPTSKSSPEIRQMIAALTVFSDNARDRDRLQSETRDAEQSKLSRAEAIRKLLSDMGETIDAAVRGDFTRRLDTVFVDADLSRFAETTNHLLQTVESSISETARVMGRLADGDLGARMECQAEGAFGALKTSTNGMMDRLQTLVTQIRSASDTVRGQSEELLAGAGDLSRRTEQQTEALERTTATLGSIAAIVQDSSARATSASRMVGDTKISAEESSRVVTDAVAAMRRIENASAEIGKIIEAINAISFQTNLLALNAGVEAARAGEAGRGFAVVAQEVRELARRAATSALEIKDLVGKTRQEVDVGVRLVNATGEALETIKQQVSEIDGFMSAIAAAAKNQTKGMVEIRSAIDDMGRLTEDNARMVGASTAATQLVFSEADELSVLISQFHIADRGRSDGRRPMLRNAA